MGILGWTALMLMYLKLAQIFDVSWGWIILLYTVEIVASVINALIKER